MVTTILQLTDAFFGGGGVGGERGPGGGGEAVVKKALQVQSFLFLVRAWYGERVTAVVGKEMFAG